MAVNGIVNTYEDNSFQKQHSGSFYDGHKIINDPIHVCVLYIYIKIRVLR